MCTWTAAKSCIAHFWGNDRMMGSCESWMERLPSRTYGWPWVQNLHWVMACSIIFLFPRQRHWHMSRWKTHPGLVFARQGDHANLEHMPSDCFGEVRESCANTRMSAQTLSTQRTGVAPSAHWTNLSKQFCLVNLCLFMLTAKNHANPQAFLKSGASGLQRVYKQWCILQCKIRTQQIQVCDAENIHR